MTMHCTARTAAASRRPALGLAMALTAVAASWAAGAPALAASKFTDLDKEPACIGCLELSKGRFEVAPFMGVTILDGSFNRLLMVGAHLKYHLSGWLDIGGHIAGTAAPISTGIRTDVCTVRDGLGMPCDSTDPDAFPGRTRTAKYEAFLQASVTPIYGKMSLFGAIFFKYEFSIFGGFGVVGTNTLAPNTLPCAERGKCLRPSPTFGTDLHMFVTQFLALDLQFRDTVVLENWYGVTNASGDLVLKANHLAMFTFGVSIFLPFTAKRSK
jgi:hypothetical protein